MDMEVTRRERNALMDRDELELAINHTGGATPSEMDVRNQIAAEEDLDPETVVIDHIYSSTGNAKSVAEIKVFDEPVIEIEEPEESEESEDETEAEESEAETEEQEAEGEETSEEENADAEESDGEAEEGAEEAETSEDTEDAEGEDAEDEGDE